jgi:hypothetical protein
MMRGGVGREMGGFGTGTGTGTRSGRGRGGGRVEWAEDRDEELPPYPIWWQRGPFFCPGTHRLTL